MITDKKIDVEIIEIGNRLLTNKKYDFNNKIDYLKFLKLRAYRIIMLQQKYPLNFDFTKISFSPQITFDTISNTTYKNEL